MRELKFRAWIKKEKKYYDIDSIQFDEYSFTPWIKVVLSTDDSDTQYKTYDFESTEYIIEQFTGLKDKNGVEIYEGDIVIDKSYPMYSDGLCNYRCAVIWCEKLACFGLEMYVVSDRVRGGVSPNSIEEYENLEIIGNVHENPELLEL